MNTMVRHSFEELPAVNITESVKVVRDGDFDAVEMVIVVPEPEIPYMVFHGLGRKVTRVSIEMKSNPCDYAVVSDGKGNFINDKDKIGLWFTEGGSILRLRFA